MVFGKVLLWLGGMFNTWGRDEIVWRLLTAEDVLRCQGGFLRLSRVVCAEGNGSGPLGRKQE